MAVDVRLPVLGDFMLEGTLVEWLRPDGARVEKGDVIYRLETDKVSLDVEAPASGVLRQVAAAGAVVPVNGLLGQIGEDAALAPPPPSSLRAAPPNSGGEPIQAAGVGSTDAAGQPASEAGSVPAAAGADALTPALSQGERGPAAGGGGVDAGAAAASVGAEDEVRASPAARRLARELSVDLAAVSRANRGTRLREEHVQAYAASAPFGVGAAPPNLGGEQLSGAPNPGTGDNGASGGGSDEELRATPAARRLARELGIEIEAVARANPGVRLREAQVQAFADRRWLVTPGGVETPAAHAGAPSKATPAGSVGAPPMATAAGSIGSPAVAVPAGCEAPTPPGIAPAGLPSGLAGQGGAPSFPSPLPLSPASAGVPLAGRRRVIAQRMQQSLQQMAQLTVSLQVDVTECVRLREQLVRLWAADGVRPTYTDFVVRATALALREHPALNATLEDDALVTHPTIDVGLAVDAPEGLIVPVLRSADRLSLRELAERAAQAAEQARANRLLPDDLHGGTFTVTTLGALGIDFFTPIVNPPQVAIIGIGRVFAQLALVNGQVTERQAMYLNLSFDHRAVDGAPASRFLNRVKELLELPVGLL